MKQVESNQLLDPSAGGSDGLPRRAAELVPLVYDELRALARRKLSRQPPGQTLQPTALVHEVFMRLTRATHPGWPGRAQFLAAAARAMRNILVDLARARGAQKRGAGRQRRDLDETAIEFDSGGENVLALDEALSSLEAHDERKATVVTLRCFGGLTTEEAAEVVGVTPRTIERDWRYARAWLRRELEEPRGPARSGA